MLLTHLALSNVRNYEQLDLRPAPGLNLFVGRNAQGKSNLLEAIAMLGTGKSFRTNRDADVVREGAELAVVRGEADVRAGSIYLACSITRAGSGTRKTYTVNGRDVRYANFLGKMRVVTFVPADLLIAGGAPSLRRSFLNVALSQDEPRYYRELARYRKAVQQKNALLRAPQIPDPELLAVYDRVLVEAGTQLMLGRDHFVRAMAAEARAAHAGMTGGSEKLEVSYAPNVAFDEPTEDGVGAALSARLAQVAESERLRKSALVGPHRDDLSLTLDGRDLGAYASQGQQRTAVLALKVAEYVVMRRRSGEPPLLLLDDVLSELDEERARAFLAGVGEYEQAFVTTTHQPDGLGSGATYRVEAGQVQVASAC